MQARFVALEVGGEVDRTGFPRSDRFQAAGDEHRELRPYYRARRATEQFIAEARKLVGSQLPE